jgi:hypothetical protein
VPWENKGGVCPSRIVTASGPCSFRLNSLSQFLFAEGLETFQGSEKRASYLRPDKFLSLTGRPEFRREKFKYGVHTSIRKVVLALFFTRYLFETNRLTTTLLTA